MRLDDGQEADEILPWLNALPEVQEAIAKHFDGVPISPQNLSAWRQGGFQEWLFQQQFFDSAVNMREITTQMQQDIDASNPRKVHCTMADYLVKHMVLRFSHFMARWDGEPSPRQKALHRAVTLTLKLQAVCRRDEAEISSSIKANQGSPQTPLPVPLPPPIQRVEFKQRPPVPVPPQKQTQPAFASSKG
jgi:hypothetical protein